MELWHILGVVAFVALAGFLLLLESGHLQQRRLLAGGLLGLLLLGGTAAIVITYDPYDWVNTTMEGDGKKKKNGKGRRGGSGGGDGPAKEEGGPEEGEIPSESEGGGEDAGKGEASASGGEEKPETEVLALKTEKDCDVCPEMVILPTGRLHMGSPDSEAGREPHEGPQVYVTFKSAFAISRDEITLANYQAFLNESDYTPTQGCKAMRAGQQASDYQDPGFKQTENEPMVCMRFRDAKAYVAWLTERSGRTYRLPSASEWEYAARAGSITAYHSGDAVRTLSAQYSGDTERNGTRAVGSFAPNRFGIHDMHGNAAEWVEDCWHDEPAAAPDNGNALSIGFSCDERMIKGGAWYDGAAHIRSAARRKGDPAETDNGLGFRVARD